MSEDLEFEIQIFIENYQKSNGGKCGLNPIEIMKKLLLNFMKLLFKIKIFLMVTLYFLNIKLDKNLDN